jgi:hypothetical protein
VFRQALCDQQQAALYCSRELHSLVSCACVGLQVLLSGTGCSSRQSNTGLKAEKLLDLEPVCEVGLLVNPTLFLQWLSRYAASNDLRLQLV